MAGKSLANDVKMFVVQSLACFDTPSVVVANATKELGVTLSRQQVERYDPTKKAGINLSAKWRAVFEETRKTFLDDTAAIGISHRAVRLRALQRMADKAETQGNMALAAQLLEQAAKEQGNAFTNRREISGPNGGPMETKQKLDPSNLTDEELEIMTRAAQRRESGAPQG